MKMCDVVKDLYGVYCDGFASDESKELIKKHLKKCPECREFYKEKSFYPAYAQSDNSGNYALLAKKIKKRRLVKGALAVSFVTVLSAVLLCELSEKGK